MQLGRLVERALADKSDAHVGETYEHLRDAAIASCSNKVIGDRMIVHAAFLVARDQAEDFDAKVHVIGKKVEGKLSFGSCVCMTTPTRSSLRAATVTTSSKC